MNRLRVGIYGVRRALNIMRRGLAGNLAQIVAVTDPDARACAERVGRDIISRRRRVH